MLEVEEMAQHYHTTPAEIVNGPAWQRLHYRVVKAARHG
jgi:hypothetical protein